MTDEASDKPDHPMAPLTRLGQRVKEAGDKRGLRLHGFAGAPNSTDPQGPHKAQIVFVTSDSGLTPKVDPQAEADFQSIVDSDARTSSERSAERSREDLEKLRDELRHDPSKGIGLDDL